MSNDGVIYEVLWVNYDSWISYGFYTNLEAAEQRLAEVIAYIKEEEYLRATYNWYRYGVLRDSTFEEFVKEQMIGSTYPDIVDHELDVPMSLDIADRRLINHYLEYIEVAVKGIQSTAIESQSTE